MIKKIALACTLAVAVVFSASAKPKVDKKVAAFDKQMESVVKDMNAVGAAAIVFTDSDVIFSKAYGVKNIETQDPLQTDNIHRVGLIGRIVVPLALTKLADEGKISLSADISQYLGFNFKNPAAPDKKITLKNLIFQNAGLNDKKIKSMADLNPESDNFAEIWSEKKGYVKSNKSFVVAAAIIEKVTGKRFDEYVQEEIFAPLGITASYDWADVKEKRAYPYAYKDGQYERVKANKKKLDDYVLGESTFKLGVENSLYISIEDYVKLLQTVLNGGVCPANKARLFSAEAAEGMLKPNKAQTRCFGFSISKKLVEGALVYAGNTTWAGVVAGYVFDPAKKIGMVTVSNGINDPEATKLADNHFYKNVREAFIDIYE